MARQAVRERRRDGSGLVHDHPHVRPGVWRALRPVISLAEARFGGIAWRDALAYIPAQAGGCVLGAVAANGMFSLAAVNISTHHGAHLFSESIATAGLLLAISVGRMFSNTFAGIAPASVPGYVAAQLIGAPAPSSPWGRSTRM